MDVKSLLLSLYELQAEDNKHSLKKYVKPGDNV